MKPCKKVGYATIEAANISRGKQLRKKGLNLKTYQCPKCKKWHLGNTRGTKVKNIDKAFDRAYIKEGWPLRKSYIKQLDGLLSASE